MFELRLQLVLVSRTISDHDQASVAAVMVINRY
jgi:hypothetical protein